jgi:monothiol glutaredoxin
MHRPLLSSAQIHPTIQSKVANFKSAALEQVLVAIDAHDVVVVGMAQNPFPGRARRLLESKNVPFHALNYGSYLSGWRERLPLKMWSGWPTFPMIFVRGRLIGGFTELKQLVESDSLNTALALPRP